MQSNVTLLFPVFADFEIQVFFTEDIRKTAKEIGERPSKNCEACCITRKNKPGYAFLLFPPRPSAATIAHESWHAIYSMLRWIGAELEDEVIAYHLGYTVGKISEYLEAQNCKQ